QPGWLRAGHPETWLFAARAAFAAGGPAALQQVVTAANAAGAPGDPDLRALASLGGGSDQSRPPLPTGPVQDYVTGLRARLRGDLDRAAHFLAEASAGHGDACRAAGEYLVVMRMLHRTPGPELDPLGAVNHECVNLVLPP